MSNLNIGKNVKNDNGVMLNQFENELNFRLDDYIRFGSREIGWKFLIPNYYTIEREEDRRKKVEAGIVLRPDYDESIHAFFLSPTYDQGFKENLKENILRILTNNRNAHSCKWSNLYVRHSKNGESIKGKFTEGKFDRGNRIPRIFYDEVSINDTIEICYCSKFIWFWWWFKPKWFKITGTIAGITVLIIKHKEIAKHISELIKRITK